jgi:hypothetical protein
MRISVQLIEVYVIRILLYSKIIEIKFVTQNYESNVIMDNLFHYDHIVFVILSGRFD